LNPRGGGRRGPLPGGGRPTSTLWYGLAFLLVLALAQMYFLIPAGRQIPYSEFKALLKRGDVAEVTVGEQTIHGTLKNAPSADEESKQFTTTRVDDPKLAEELEANQVKFSGELVNHWLPELLGWILPLVFIFAIWAE
jgi:cell division protease FtsH